MIIKIEIDCETISEAYQHMSVIGKEIKSKAKKEKLDPLKDEFKPCEWYDDNCYGTHYVEVREDEMLKNHNPGTGMFNPSK